MSVLPIGMSGEAGAYQITRSLRFNSADSAYLNRTPASAGNRRTWTFSAWVKRSALGRAQYIFGATQDSYNVLWTLLSFDSADRLSIEDYQTSSYRLRLITTQVFRDPSAWYHIVVAIDTTQATNTNRVKLYINGSQITEFGTSTYPTQNIDTYVDSANPHTLSSNVSTTTVGISGYLTDINLIDGSALTPSSFGETDTDTGVWKPKQYTGSYGTNGFNLKFADNSGTTSTTLGKDSSSNGNNWTPNNFSVTAGAGNDSLVDTPTPYGTDTGVGGEVRGNYATLNPLAVAGASAITISNGNLDLSIGTSGAWRTAAATFPMSSGKWYWEVRINTASDLGDVIIGVAAADAIPTTSYSGSTATSYGYMGAGFKYNNGSATSYGATMAAGDTIGVSLDMSTGALVFYRNGSSQGTAYTLDTTKTFVATVSGASTTPTYSVNFGQRPFAYTAPSGFKALCTQNLPTPTIGATPATQANKYFDVVLRNGGAPSGGTYSTTVNMANGALLWDKPRNQASSNYLIDSVRGISKLLIPNQTAVEATDASWFTGFNNGSFNTGSSDWSSSTTVVDWIWAANGSGVTNTAGSVTSTVSANTTSGFSVVTWTGSSAGQTVGHGLGVAPSLIIAKTRSASGEPWPVYHKDLGVGNFLLLNSTAAANSTYSTYWGSSAPSSTVFGTFTGGYPSANNNGNMVAYCFAPVAGYSAFGSYTGNGDASGPNPYGGGANGPFVHLGFRPAFVLIKNATNGTNWVIYDTRRESTNVMKLKLYPNTSDAEDTNNADFIDILSNGFKIRSPDNKTNVSGSTFIYAAFAENPFKYSLAR